MKLYLIALAAMLSGCVTTLRPCSEAGPALEADQQAHGRQFLGQDMIAPGVTVEVYQAKSDDAMYVLLFSAPGALVPPDEPPFEFVEQCTTVQGMGRLYRAKINPPPKA